jgi:hypothetical protein
MKRLLLLLLILIPISALSQRYSIGSAGSGGGSTLSVDSLGYYSPLLVDSAETTGRNYATYRSVNNQINANRTPAYIKSMQVLGSTIVTSTLGLSPTNVNGSAALTDNRLELVALDYVFTTTRFDSISMYQTTKGNYNADAASFNGVALYKLNATGDSIIRVAYSANDSTFLEHSTGGWTGLPFTAAYTGTAGQYFAGVEYAVTAVAASPTPVIGGRTSVSAGMFNYGPGRALTSFYIANAATTPPAKIKFSDCTVYTTTCYYFRVHGLQQ